MSSTVNDNEIIALTEPRQYANGMNLTGDQAVQVPDGLKMDTLTIPSSSQPSFGSYCVCDFREKEVILSNLTLEINASAISDLSGTVANYPRFSPVWFWINRIEFFQGGSVTDTLYPDEQFIRNQILYNDQDRLTINGQAGDYNNAVQRATLSAATSSWYLNLQCFLDQDNIPFFSNAHDLQLRIYFNSVADIVSQSTLTGTPVATINYCNLLAKIVRLPPSVAAQQKQLMYRLPFDHIYHDLRHMTATVQSGVTSTTVITSAIVGDVAALMFVCRDVGSTTKDNAFVFKAITSFEILNSSSTNIVGGQAVSRALSLMVQGKSNCKSSYLNETDIGTSYTGTLNNYANAMIYSFSQNLPDALANGKRLGTYTFTGSEQLKLTFTSSLSTALQIDIYAYTESRLHQSFDGVQKIPF